MTTKEQADRVAARIAGYMRLYHMLDEEMAVVMRITRPTFSKRKKHPETYRIGELILAAKKFNTTVQELVGGGAA